MSSGVWFEVRSRVIEACPCLKASTASERANIRAELGARGSGAGGGEHEMSSFRSFERPDGVLGPEGEPQYDEYGNVIQMQNGMNTDLMQQEKIESKINEWQAGWNVTNAIQVGGCSS